MDDSGANPPVGDTALEESMHDENAFGLLVSWFDAEDVEYSQSADKFPPRLTVLRSAVSDYASCFPLGAEVSALDFGTLFYFELADGEHVEDPVSWLRALRAFLSQGDWVTSGFLTHGGRWVGHEPRQAPAAGGVRWLVSHGPSEALRRALAAETRCHGDEEAGEESWGPGLFIDTDALEALGRKLKNQPTVLRAGGASFVRISG
jgi:hypothetical protein